MIINSDNLHNDDSVVTAKAAPTTTTTSSSSSNSSSRMAVNEAELIDEEAFLEQCRKLCEVRNIPFDKVKNARDLASVRNSPVRPGRIYRMGRIGDASDDDVRKLMEELNIRTLVDLRSPTELKDDPSLLRPQVFASFTEIVWRERKRHQKDCLKTLEPGEFPVPSRKFWKKQPQQQQQQDKQNNDNIVVVEEEDQHEQVIDQELFPVTFSKDDDLILQEMEEECGIEDECSDEQQQKLQSSQHRRERHFVSLMNEFKYVKGTVSKLRKRDITKAILKSPGAVFSRRMRASLKKPFLDEINDGGLPMLNELLLRFGAPGIKYVLTLIADETRHPIAFYCTAGKDRTGIIAAITLALCGVPRQDIVEDYTLSANVYAEMNDHTAMVGALSQRNLDPKTFLGAPASVMRDTLDIIEREYGSVQGYCDWIGFDREQQEKLKRACMDERSSWSR
jgi:hypothetical protein